MSITRKIKLGSATKPVRLSYVTLVEPKAIEEGKDKKFSVSVIISKDDTATIKSVKEAVSSIAKEKWATKIPPKMWDPLKDGDLERPDDKAYANSYFLSCKSDRRPVCITRRKEVITVENLDSQIYSGCYAIVSTTLFDFDTSANKGIGASVDAIQKVSEGDPLSGSVVDIDAEFEDLGDDSEEYDPLA